MLLQKLGADTGLALPTSKTESWKYTPLRALDVAAAKLQPGALSAAPNTAQWLSETAQVPLPNGAQAQKASGTFAQLAARTLGFAMPLDGAHYFCLSPNAPHALVQQSHDFNLYAGCTATLLWHHCGEFESSFANYLTQITLGENAQLDLIRVQQASLSASLIERTEISLAAGAKVRVIDINFGAQLARHELHIALDGAAAHAEVLSLSALQGRQHCDTQLVLNHRMPNTSSLTRVKAVADARARSVFNGRIYVAKGADGTDAQLRTNNLLLSDMAEIDAKPELEIHAEDVKCSHGATVGQLDENALFYLRTRGIDAVQARQILTVAFCQELLDAITDVALRAKLVQILQTKLPTETVPTQAGNIE
jgi:FeS assembly protein SufD